MRPARLASAVCLGGFALAVAVGPGISLTRCSLTGRVSLDCCCDQVGGLSPTAALGDSAPGCCTVQRLAAPWMADQVAAWIPPAIVPAVAAASSVALDPFAFPVKASGALESAAPPSRRVLRI